MRLFFSWFLRTLSSTKNEVAVVLYLASMVVCARVLAYGDVCVVVGQNSKRYPPWQPTMVATAVLPPPTTTSGGCVCVCGGGGGGVGLTFCVNQNALDGVWT